jgi:F0F1-type ATP synthase assembly protein I
MNYVITIIIALSMVFSGVIVGILIGVGKIQQGALLIIAPMILGGCFILAVLYVKRRFNDSSNNNHTK